jgi:hypothetical protein
MTQAMADFVFMATDDLVIEKRAATGDPPVQQIVVDGSGDGVTRQTEGRYSWAVMLCPIFPKTIPPVPLSNQTTNEYRASFIVFYNRSLQRGEDKVAQISDPADFHNAGIGGGDVTIHSRSGQPASDLEAVRKGQWCCLVPSTSHDYFRWYRIVDADSEVDTTSDPLPRLAMTLEGEDWPVNPGWAAPAIQPGYATPYVIVPENVVAVYERTVRLGETAWAD